MNLRQRQTPQHAAVAAAAAAGVVQPVTEATTVQQSSAKLCDMILWYVEFCVVQMPRFQECSSTVPEVCATKGCCVALSRCDVALHSSLTLP